MNEYTIFTSESVSEGHPDKLADRISDAVLDEMLRQHPDSRVACETLIKSGLIVLAGETRSHAKVDFDAIARRVVRETGYVDELIGMDSETCRILNAIGKQSPDISRGVEASPEDNTRMGAGDQGMMFGYATCETQELMPAPIAYAHRLMRKHAEVRRNSGSIFRPDAKCQLTFRYEDGKPKEITTVVFSTQHTPDVTLKQVKEAVREEIILPTLFPDWEGSDPKYFINPTGNFVVGGPDADCGLTGRKIIVDTYGGMARHGGGAFSGKDPSKVDRSASYAVRYVAKNIVAAKLADRCEIQVSYAIGKPEPTSISVNTFGTGNKCDKRIEDLIGKHFELCPDGLIEMLDLKRPIYEKTATFGHFGRTEEEFTWERTEKAEDLRADAGL